VLNQSVEFFSLSNFRGVLSGPLHEQKSYSVHIYSLSQKNNCLSIILWCLHMLTYFYNILAHSILTKYAPQKLLICPRRLHNAAALPWENSYQFLAFRTLFSPEVCRWLWKESAFWCWHEDADLKMDRVTADARSDHQLAVTQTVKCSHATSAFSSCRPLKSFPYSA